MPSPSSSSSEQPMPTTPERYRAVEDHEALKASQLRARRDNPRSTNGWAAACERGELVRMQQLLAAGQEINALDEQQQAPALYIAARTNNLELARWLLESGADPAVTTEDDGWTPALICISKGCAAGPHMAHSHAVHLPLGALLVMCAPCGGRYAEMLRLLLTPKYGFGAAVALGRLTVIPFERHLELAKESYLVT